MSELRPSTFSIYKREKSDESLCREKDNVENWADVSFYDETLIWIAIETFARA